MPKTIKKNGLLLTNNSHFVSVAHESGEFRVCFAPDDDNRVYMAMTIPFFRVIASLVRFAVNNLEPNSPLSASLQVVLFDDFDQLLRLVAKHPDMVKAFENSPR